MMCEGIGELISGFPEVLLLDELSELQRKMHTLGNNAHRMGRKLIICASEREAISFLPLRGPQEEERGERVVNRGLTF